MQKYRKNYDFVAISPVYFEEVEDDESLHAASLPRQNNLECVALETEMLLTLYNHNTVTIQ